MLEDKWKRGILLSLLTFTLLFVPLSYIILSDSISARAILKTMYNKAEGEFVFRTQMNYQTIMLYSSVDALIDYIHFEKDDIPVLTKEDIEKYTRDYINFWKNIYSVGEKPSVKQYMSYSIIATLRGFLWFHYNVTHSTVLLLFDSYATIREFKDGLIRNYNDFLAYPSNFMYRVFYSNTEKMLQLKKETYAYSSNDVRILLTPTPIKYQEKSLSVHRDTAPSDDPWMKFIGFILNLIGRDERNEFFNNFMYENNFWCSAINLVSQESSSIIDVLYIDINIHEKNTPSFTSFEKVGKELSSQDENKYIVAGPLPVIAMWYLSGPIERVYGFAGIFPSVTIRAPVKIVK